MRGLKGTWSSVFKDFGLVLLIVFVLRWAVAEPFLVPSGSMIPSLLIKDYILATKYSYGLRVPFTKAWLWGPHQPERGDVVVFKSKGDNFYFMVKRVVGLPGDRLRFDQDLKTLFINDKPMERTLSTEGDYDVYLEQFEVGPHLVQYDRLGFARKLEELTIPEGHLFVMGDNRDRSSDSRVWGTLPMENLMGKASVIWMSCKGDSSASSVLCLGSDLRTERLFKKIQ